MAADKYKSRHALIADLKRSGAFDGETIKSVEAMNASDARKWFENNVDLKGWSGADVEALWTKKVTIAVEADAGEEVEVMSPQAAEPEDVEMDEDEPEPKARKTKGVSATGGRLAQAAAPVNSFNTPTSELGRQIKAYDNAIKSGRTFGVRGYGFVQPAFNCGEKAACYGAWVRKRLIDMYPAELGEYRKDADMEYLTKAHGTTVNNLGGALVPNDFLPDAIDLPSEYGAFRRAAGTTTMSRDTLTVPRVRNRFDVGDIGENTEITSQDKPTFDNVTLTAAKKGGIVRISNELLNDSAVNLGEILARDIQRGFDKYIDDSALLGSNGYSGMAAANFTAAGTDHYDAALSTPLWSEYDIADIETWLSLIPSAAWSAGNVAIVCHRAFFGAVLARFGASAAAVSDSGAGLFNSAVPLGSGVQASYRGLPVYFTDSMPSSVSSNQISAIAGSFSASSKYGEVTGSDELTTSDQRYFEYDQVGFRALRRFAINNHNVGGSDSSKASMVIGLKD